MHQVVGELAAVAEVPRRELGEAWEEQSEPEKKLALFWPNLVL